ncbi:hypothetical protein F5884DRAFT_877288 [Xylogone sp. PMI_703]|nr:hypothetical protein F5884DRAFT_877288 [Xylogone sp. PMI_703]
MAHQHMSLESMLDQERREVLALLEGPSSSRPRGSASSAGSGRASSPFTPRSPVRSMLDVGDDVPDKSQRHASIAGINTGVTPAQRGGQVRSMLDISSPPPKSVARSAQTSPTEPTHKQTTNKIPPRSLSDAASRPAEFGPRASNTRSNPTANYQFAGFLSSNPGGPIIPKRNTQAGKKMIPNTMAEIARGVDLSGFGAVDNGHRHSSKSRSPHNRLSLRSASPHSGMLSPDQIALDSGRVLDLNNAYRRLSDANLARSGTSLSALSAKKDRKGSKDTADDENTRLEKDYTPIDGDLPDDSSDDIHSSDEENRGRKKESRDENTTLGMGRAKGPRTAQSLLAAAEEERQQIAAQQSQTYKIRSLLEPEITVTAPAGDKLKSSKPGVHPNTSFDQGTPGFLTPVDSETEAEFTDIKRAQKLSIVMTPIVSTPATNRCVRTLYRGDFATMQKEAEENHRRVRKYLVATDLSDEAQHALEWTVGTVLRDGDTLLAIYCVDEELGIATPEGDADMKEQVAAIAASTKPSGSTPILAPSPAPSHLGVSSRVGSESMSSSPSGLRDKAEQERYKAVNDITDRVSKLLRKTKLQVKVVIEVIHCKSPRHLITEVIDYINPTLVILGSRGRSALKGVILGSFSNYLVTKSSVPVMVARKRLRKHSKYKRPAIRLANNLSNPAVRSLASAKID